MIDTVIKYQSAIFANSEDILPNPGTIKGLIDIYSDKSFIPGTIQEMTGKGPLLRLRMGTPDEMWSITILSNRINIEQQSIAVDKQNDPDISYFANESKVLFERFLNKFPKMSFRLAINSAILLKELEIPKLTIVQNKLFNNPPFYKANPPFEWHSKMIARYPFELNHTDENLNVATNIDRVQGEKTLGNIVTPFDRLMIKLDISTTEQNSNSRFAISQINEYFDRMPAFYNNFLKEMQEYLDA